MKNLIVTIINILLIFPSFGQTEKLEEYTASNGVTYKIGDEIKLGRGSDTNGKFVYVSVGGWAVSTDPEENRLPASNAGLIVTVKKIKKYNMKRHKGVYFTIGGGNITNYFLDIENAIATCEIEECTVSKEKTSSSDKYDRLRKLKELYDEGILTEEEYKKEKEKILNEN